MQTENWAKTKHSKQQKANRKTVIETIIKIIMKTMTLTLCMAYIDTIILLLMTVRQYITIHIIKVRKDAMNICVLQNINVFMGFRFSSSELFPLQEWCFPL